MSPDSPMSDGAWQEAAWRPLATHRVVRLAPTLLSGMSFRWSRVSDNEGTFVGVIGTMILEVRECGGGLEFRCAEPSYAAEAAALLRAHLRLDDDDGDCDEARFWRESAATSPAMSRYRKCASRLPGVRVLHILDAWECVVTFMGSANNNIKRNMQMARSLAAAFPANLIGTDAYGEEHHSWPTVEEVSTLSEETLWDLGWGYRAPRLYKLCRQAQELGGTGWLHALSTERDTPTARAALMQLTGVGRKVADCVLLFGFRHDHVVPVDTHCLQLANRYLLPGVMGRTLTPAVHDQINESWRAAFGRTYAGWAFMQLFVAELADFRKLVDRPGEDDAGKGNEEDDKGNGRPSACGAGEVVLQAASSGGTGGKARRKKARPSLPLTAGGDIEIEPATPTRARRTRRVRSPEVDPETPPAATKRKRRVRGTVELPAVPA